MAIRFACTNCRQTLQIAERKAGSKVKCPKCHSEQTVPSATALHAAGKAAPATTGKSATKPAVRKPAATTATASTKAIEAESFPEINFDISAPAAAPVIAAPDFASLVAFDDVPAAVTGPPLVAPAATSAVSAKTEFPRTAPAVVVDRSLVAVSRTVLYVQAVLIVAVALAAFTIGYLAGRGQRQPSPEELAALQQPVPVEGDVFYRTAAGLDAPDAGAVVIAIPYGITVDPKLPTSGLSPGQPPEDNQAQLSVQTLETEGGGFARTSEGGQFNLKLRPGKYWMLVISANADRADGVLPKIGDVRVLGRYFDGATDLLANHRYRLSKQQLPTDEMLEFALDAAP